MVWIPTKRKCKVCGEPFSSKATGRTCSPKCRQSAYRERQRLAARQQQLRTFKAAAESQAKVMGGKL